MKNQIIFIAIFLNILYLNYGCKVVEPRYNFANSNIYLKLTKTGDTIKYNIIRNDKVIQSVHLDKIYKNAILKSDHGEITVTGDNVPKINFKLLTNNGNKAVIKVTRLLKKPQIMKDCIDLEIGKLNWFGGPQNRYQYWPIEKSNFTAYSYVSKETDNCAITERYWLNSRGVFFFVDSDVPLFIEENSKNNENLLCFVAKKELPYDTYTDSFNFNYNIGIASNAKEAQLLAVEKYLGKPKEIPDERMVRHPIWSTWAKYKKDINEEVVRDFAQTILDYKFTNSQFEIDDDWEECYGSLTFNKKKFPNIKQLTKDLKEQGFRVTLWIHPFINKDCKNTYNEAKEKGYLVLNHENNPDTSWWNSNENEAAYIDFTKPEAAKWFVQRLKRLQTEDGIDNFKFDAGESSWVPSDPKLNSPTNLSPSSITTAYIRTVAQLGNVVEVRSGQGTQDLGIFLRMLDKDTNWSWNNGLPTLITTLLQLNLAGYSFILPDMIGGNGYNKITPDKEIFIRWLQANVFMPSLQYSYVPWLYDTDESEPDTVKLSLHFNSLHDKYTDYIMERFKLVRLTGEPVNPPIWWLDPTDTVALQITDEFLLGDKILVAPVIQKGQIQRDIYLPKGIWVDGNNSKVTYTGPKWLMNYQAPLEILPYFTRLE